METDQEYKTRHWASTILQLVKNHIKKIEELETLQTAMSCLFNGQDNSLYVEIIHATATKQLIPVIQALHLFGGREEFEKVLGLISNAHAGQFDSKKLPSKNDISNTFKYLIADLVKPVQLFLTSRDDIKNAATHQAICHFLNKPSGVNRENHVSVAVTPYTSKKNLLKKLPFALFDLLASHTTYRESQDFTDDKILDAFFPTQTTPLRGTKYFPVFLFNMTQTPDCNFKNHYSFILQQETDCFYNMLVEAHQSDSKDQKNPSVQRHISTRDRQLNEFYECCTNLKNAVEVIKNSLDSTDKALRIKAKARLKSKELIDKEYNSETYPYTNLIARDKIADILIVLKKVINAHKKSKTRAKNSSKQEINILLPRSLREQLKDKHGKRPDWSAIVVESIKKIKSLSKKQVVEESANIGFDKKSIKAAYRNPDYASITPKISENAVKSIEIRAKKCDLNMQEYYNFALAYYSKNPNKDQNLTTPAKTGVEQFGLGKQPAIAASSDTQQHTESDIPQVETTEQINATPTDTIELSDTSLSLLDNEPQTESRATLQKNDLTDHEPPSSKEIDEVVNTSFDKSKLEAQFKSAGFSVKINNRKITS